MRLACLAAFSTLTAPAAHAFVPRGVSGPARVRTVAPDRGIGGWQTARDRDTGVLARMSGSYVHVPGAIRDPAIAERAARAFLAQHLADLAPGARIEDLVLAANRVDAGKRTVAFWQTWRGLRVMGGQVHVVFANDRLFFAASSALPDVAAAPPRARPRGRRVVVGIFARGGIEYRVADVIEAGHEDVYVDPDTRAELARESRVHHATSTLTYDVGQRYATGPRVAIAASNTSLTVDGAPTTSLADGTFSWPTNVAATVVPGLAGTYVAIVNEAGPLATASLTAQPGLPVTWSMAGDELADAQLSAYAYVTVAKAIGKRIAPSLAWIDQQLAVHVNIDDSCNAFSSGDSIHFFKASAECQNTARLADVVHHEFGHSFHAQAIIPGAGGTDASIVEGVADFFAANVTSDPGIGRGFFFNDEAVRELDPIGSERVYPRDNSLVPHTWGLIIGGALWDLRKQLIARHGEAAGIAATERIYLGILQRAADLTMTYDAALVADDDDGDLGNGTPNSCIIESAFGRHGLAGASFRETTLAPPTIVAGRVSVTVETPAGTACPPAQITGIDLRWRTGDGSLAAIPMAASGATWSADLPAQPDGTVIEYQVVATTSTSETLVFPDNPADPLYQYFAGEGTEIFCERFEVDPGWKQHGAIEWDVGVSNPVNAAAGDPETAYEGMSWLGTDLRGDGRYRADIQTSIETPPIDATAYGRVHLQFRRWLVIEDAGLDVATVRVGDTQLWANAKNSANTLDHVDKEWRFVDFDLTPYNTGPLTISWTLASDPLRQLGGWNLDEICIVGLDKKPLCGDGIVDDGEECDGSADCEPTCVRRTDDDGGCCSSTTGLPTSLVGLALVQLLMIWSRRARRR